METLHTYQPTPERSYSPEFGRDKAVIFKLSEIAVAQTIEVPADESELESRKRQLGIVDWVDFPRDSFQVKGQEKPVVASEIDRNISEQMIGYLEGESVLDDLNNPKLRRFVDANETQFLLDIQAEADISRQDKDFYLMQVHNRILERANSHKTPEQPADFSLYSALKHTVKTEYIMNMNETISDYIDGVSKKSGNKLSTLLDGVRTISIRDINIQSLRKNTANLAYLKDNFEDSSSIIRKINSLVEGMRHEAGFKELISEIPEDIIEIVETDKDQDSHGVDMILKVKISNKRSSGGDYKLASATEIDDEDYQEIDLPVDIKSSKYRAYNVLSKMTSGKTAVDHWVMWSHINDDDFRLGTDPGSEKAEIVCSRENAPFYLDYSVQIAALKSLRSGERVEDYRAYSDETGKLEYVNPAPLRTRLEDIKRDIETGINFILNRKTE